MTRRGDAIGAHAQFSSASGMLTLMPAPQRPNRKKSHCRVIDGMTAAVDSEPSIPRCLAFPMTPSTRLTVILTLRAHADGVSRPKTAGQPVAPRLLIDRSCREQQDMTADQRFRGKDRDGNIADRRFGPTRARPSCTNRERVLQVVRRFHNNNSPAVPWSRVHPTRLLLPGLPQPDRRRRRAHHFDASISTSAGLANSDISSVPSRR
jgi:hypothetical protein